MAVTPQLCLVAYFFQVLNKIKWNYSATEFELLAIIFGSLAILYRLNQSSATVLVPEAIEK